MRFKRKGRVRWRSTFTEDPVLALVRRKKIIRDEDRRAEGIPLLEETASRDPVELLDSVLAFRVRKNKCGEDHAKNVRRRVMFFLDGTVSIANLTPDWIEKKLAELEKKEVTNRASKQEGKPRLISPQTLNQYIQTLKTFFNQLIKMRLWDRNPVEHVEEYGEGDLVAVYRPFTEPEVRVFFASVPLERIAAYLMCGGDSLRRRELQRLKVGDLTLYPPDGVPPSVLILRKTAKNKKRCTLALHPELVPVLKLVTHGKAPADPVFDSVPRADTFRRDVIAADLQRETRDGILTSTSLRKFLETELSDLVSDQLRKQITRHGKQDVSEKHYIRFTLNRQVAALGLLSFLPPERLAEIEARLAEVERSDGDEPDPPKGGSPEHGPRVAESDDSAVSATEAACGGVVENGVPVADGASRKGLVAQASSEVRGFPQPSASANSATSAGGSGV